MNVARSQILDDVHSRNYNPPIVNLKAPKRNTNLETLPPFPS
jgi:hypothetical protein